MDIMLLGNLPNGVIKTYNIFICMEITFRLLSSRGILYKGHMHMHIRL